MSIVYQIGRSGEGPCASCHDVSLLPDAGRYLAPGLYWIDELRPHVHAGFPAPVEETLDWGTLQVLDDGRAIVRQFTPRGVEVV